MEHTLQVRVNDQEREIVERYAAVLNPKSPNMSAAVRAIIREWYVVEGRQFMAEAEESDEAADVLR